jgi:hypothetical protein
MRRQDEEHVAAIPEREREEVRQVLAGWGLDDELRERVVDAVTADPDRWIGLMMLLEHGFSPSRTGPARAALATFAAFVTVGFVPLAPFVIDAPARCRGGLGVLVEHGLDRDRVLRGRRRQRRRRGARLVAFGLETLVVGDAAAALAFLRWGAGLGGLA